MANKNKWEIVHDMDDEETGEPCSWVKEVENKEYKQVWITENKNGKFDIEVDDYASDEFGFHLLKTCKTLASAKRWVAMNLCT